MDHVRAGGDSASSDANALVPHFSAASSARAAIEIGDADQLDVGRERLDRGDVELADVAGADHAGAKALRVIDALLALVSIAISSTVRATSATRADQVSCVIAAERAARAAGESLGERALDRRDELVGRIARSARCAA